MSQTDPKPAGKGKKSPSLLFDLPNMNAAMWAPYSPATNLLAGAQHNARTFIQMNRRLADEFREIARRQQDFALDLAARMLNQTSGTAGSRKSSGTVPKGNRRRGRDE